MSEIRPVLASSSTLWGGVDYKAAGGNFEEHGNVLELDCSGVSEHIYQNTQNLGQLWWLSVLALPSAQGVIWRPGIESQVGLPARNLLLPLSMSLPLSLSLMNK